MRMPPNRVAVVALVLLGLAAGIGWWVLRAKPGSIEPLSAKESAARVVRHASGEAPAQAPADASSRGPCGSALRQAFDLRANALLQRQDAPAQLAYAFTAPSQDLPDPERVGEAAYQREYKRVALERQSRIDAALLRAFALAPEDGDVRWLAAVYCSQDEACAAPRRALLAAEADNTAVWLRELTWARRRGDPSGVERAFAAAAEAQRFETHRGIEQEMVLAAYEDLPLPAACGTPEGRRELRNISQRGEDEHVTMLDLALLRAHSMKVLSEPGLSDLRERCKPEVFPAAGATVQDRCRKILRRLATQGSWRERAIALESLVAATAGEPGAAQWRERMREVLWMQEAGADPGVQSLLRGEDYMLDEMTALQEALRAQDHWPPPADWLPADERARSLILTGRPPPGPPK